MVGLDGENPGSGFQVGFVADQRGRAFVRGDADVFEDEGGEQEIVLVLVRVERLVRPDQTRARAAAVKLFLMSIAGRDTAAPPKAVRRNFTCANSSPAISWANWRTVPYGTETAPRDRRSRRPGAGAGGEAVRESVAVDCVRIELRLQVFQVQREVQDRRVSH